jgi:hypothetical protein
LQQEASFPGWTADRDHPGYLIRPEGPVILRTPFHLVPIFPTEDFLKDVWRISRLVKTSPQSVICVSGSICTTKVTRAVNDIDFCEYINFEKPDTVDRIAVKFARNEDFIFKRLQFNGKTWTNPLDMPNMKEHLSYIDAQKKSLATAKIDYIVKIGSFRPYEVSNVMIFCDDCWSSAARDRTFAAQEVLLDASIRIPNEICNPFEMGRYAFYLYQQVLDLLKDKKYLKSINRALLLSRIHDILDLTDTIKRFLESRPEVYDHEIEEIDKLIDELDKIDKLAYEAWASDLKAERKLKESEKHSLKRTMEFDNYTVKSFAEAIQNRLKRLFSDRPVVA